MNFRLDKEQWISVFRGLLIALAGATATYLTTLSGVDFGVWTPLAVTGFSVLANYLRKVAGV